MKKQQVKIYGDGGHARVVRQVLEENGINIQVVINDFPIKGKKNLLSGIAENNITTLNSHIQDSTLVIAIGNNEIRKRISKQLRNATFQIVKHRSAVVAPDVTIGEGSVIFAGAIIQTNTTIGKHVIINTAASIDHDNHIGDYVHISPNATLTGHVTIGEGSHIGAGAVIIPGVKIGKWCTIGAGAVIIKDIPDHSTVVGNPGRIIKRKVPEIKASQRLIETGFDLAFIGAGISTAFTLLNYLQRNPIDKTPVKIAVIDKNDEFFTGIPYGKRSGESTLLLSPLSDFLPEKELNRFVEWLKVNKDWLLKRLQDHGGIRTHEWMVNNQKKLDAGKWKSLHIPRVFFGYYIQERLQNAIREAENHRRAEIVLLKENITRLEKIGSNFVLTGESGILHSKRVILGIGAPRKIRLNTVFESSQLSTQSLVISNPYEKGMDHTIKSILRFASKTRKSKPRVVLLGANASALELLYKMTDLQGIDSRIEKYYLLSTHGITPNTLENNHRYITFTPKHTLALKSVKQLTAKIIAQAVNKDLTDAEALDIDHAISGEPISRAFKPLIQKLTPEEKEKFACYYGDEIGRRQRIAGCHYNNALENLKKEGRLEHIRGNFETLLNTGYHPVSVQYTTSIDDRSESESISADIVINCLGAIKLTDPQVPEIIQNMVASGKASINPSQRGIRVNQNLESAPGIHIIGPLLTGNVIDGNPIWHAEHCGRVIELTEVLANRLASLPADQRDTRLRLTVHEISSQHDITAYKNLLNDYEDHPYYRYEYFAHHSKDEGELIVLELRDPHRSLCIMPLLKRPIKTLGKTKLYDVISPYGYSGPLFRKGINSQTKKRFWELVDSWYQKQHIISEFIRFNHLNNHEGYNGILLPTLHNVKGKILKDADEQWKGFRSKVRNNYRKAVNDKLYFRAYTGNEITMEHIRSFRDIYIETMDRNHASSNYFFDLEYFTQLIGSDPQSFMLAFALKEETIISAELIILHNDTMFAFLGGTKKAYFSSRPNDFLRVEITKKGRAKGMLWYILGGGIKDLDGLYKSKKYLFPKDTDFTFYTGRKIVNKEVYVTLCKELDLDTQRTNAFFPLYRSVKDLQRVR
ncbi:NeuD/PglB/VioB family sugar acetyltransferase [Robertkochia sediminum]|uniref:NeuD/PglB/VioB family sugar acetyltransferase n=1 Tax=Robertkochia sediminum TaxID=2785326 RepID=UPI0019335ACA|nr:NeuD/PglB/VioB family sugar acetyltransferase [Robertkochia sediminum]MBL7474054.1 NeuD/PglB/VioB family sugar acetyltransferase [Robertkochia sediminum]